MLSRLARRVTAYEETTITAKLAFTNALGEAKSIVLDATLYAPGASVDEALDGYAAFTRRGTTFWEAEETRELTFKSSGPVLEKMDVDMASALLNFLLNSATGSGRLDATVIIHCAPSTPWESASTSCARAPTCRTSMARASAGR